MNTEKLPLGVIVAEVFFDPISVEPAMTVWIGRTQDLSVMLTTQTTLEKGERFFRHLRRLIDVRRTQVEGPMLVGFFQPSKDNVGYTTIYRTDLDNLVRNAVLDDKFLGANLKEGLVGGELQFRVEQTTDKIITRVKKCHGQHSNAANQGLT
jgi:hypothetical protein